MNQGLSWQMRLNNDVHFSYAISLNTAAHLVKLYHMHLSKSIMKPSQWLQTQTFCDERWIHNSIKSNFQKKIRTHIFKAQVRHFLDHANNQVVRNSGKKRS